MLGLFIERVWHIDGDSGLGESQEEAIGEAMAGQAMESTQAVAPMVTQGLAIAANNVVTRSAGERGADFKAGGEDQAIYVIVLIADLNTRPG